MAGLFGSLISIAVFDYYDPIRWPIVLLPRLVLFLAALAPLALVHALHLRARIGTGPALTAPIVGLGGSVALIAVCAFGFSLVVNWRQPSWVSVLPSGIRYAASIPGPLAVLGGAWFGLVEWAVLGRVARPGGWRLLLPAAAILCALAILVTHYFAARWGRPWEWVAAALLSLPLAGAAYGALTQFILRSDSTPPPKSRPDRRLGQDRNKRLFLEWLSWHLATALIGGVATMFLAFPVFEQFENEMARSNASLGIHPAVLLPLAAAPIAAYQAWALRKAIQPMIWLGLVLLVALPPCPHLLLFAWSIWHHFSGPRTSFASILMTPALVGLIWAGVILGFPMLAVTAFWRWILQGGIALGIGAVAIYLGWAFMTHTGWLSWPAGIVTASLVFALFTYRVVRPALTLAQPATPSPAGA